MQSHHDTNASSQQNNNDLMEALAHVILILGKLRGKSYSANDEHSTLKALPNFLLNNKTDFLECYKTILQLKTKRPDDYLDSLRLKLLCFPLLIKVEQYLCDTLTNYQSPPSYQAAKTDFEKVNSELLTEDGLNIAQALAAMTDAATLTEAANLRAAYNTFFTNNCANDDMKYFIENIMFSLDHPECLDAFFLDYGRLTLKIWQLADVTHKKINDPTNKDTLSTLIKEMLVQTTEMGLMMYLTTDTHHLDELSRYGLSPEKKKTVSQLISDLKKPGYFESTLNILKATFTMSSTNALIFALEKPKQNNKEFELAMRTAINNKAETYKKEHGLVVIEPANTSTSTDISLPPVTRSQPARSNSLVYRFTSFLSQHQGGVSRESNNNNNPGGKR
jgi:hypothetical protein